MSFLSLIALLVTATAYGQPHSGHGAPSKSNSTPKQANAATEAEARVPITVTATQQARMGVRLSKVERKPVEHTIRTVGTITADQTKEAHVHTRINGWIEQIQADYIGKPVKKDQPLFDLYSPELVSTQEEFVSAKKQGEAGSEIARAALDRLALWGVSKKEIDRLRKSLTVKRTIGFESPVDGIVVNKTAIRGMYITPEMELYHIADLSRVWVLVTLYEYDMATIQPGDEAVIQLPYDPGKTFNAKVDYIYPEVEMETRTAKARIVLANPNQTLKPGMFANVELKKGIGDSLIVPEDSVIDTGVRKILFVKTSDTTFEPREVKVGQRVGNLFVILSGLKEGEEVATSANFLLDAESKLQAALQKGTPTVKGHSGHSGK